MTWITLLLIDILYALQLITFLQWYYPKVIIVTGCTTSPMIIETIIAILEMISCYLLTVYNLRKAYND